MENARAYRLTSPAFDNEGEIPTRFTCEGEDVSPPLLWADLPTGTKSLALIVEDPDAPDPEAPQRIWVHWGAYHLPPQTLELDEGGPLPAAALSGKNDWGKTVYGGPCPPIGRHRYFRRLYALDRLLPDLDAPTRDELLAAMEGRVLGCAQLIGTYEKKKTS